MTVQNKRKRDSTSESPKPNKKTPEKNKKTPEKVTKTTPDKSNNTPDKTPKAKNVGDKTKNNNKDTSNKDTSNKNKNKNKDNKEGQVRHTFGSTAWAYWTEWHDVYALLFSPQPHDQTMAIARVSSWRSRGILPVSVECTAGLVEAMMLDKATASSRTQNSDNKASSHSLKLLYSSTITRLVNGILDAKQLAFHSVPLSQLAAENSFPQTLVDIRHQVSHYSELPSLQVLRQAAEKGLNWLKTMYWERQTNALVSLRQSILQTLLKYATIMHNPVKDRLANSTESPGLQDNSLVRITQVKRCLEEITTIANPNLVQEALVPLLLAINTQETESNSFLLPPGQNASTGVPQELILIWHIALRKFSHVWAHFPMALILALVNQVIDLSDPSAFQKGTNEYEMNSLRVAWISHVLHNYFPISFFGNHGQPRKSGAILSIANLCLKNLNLWTKQILGIVLKYSNESYAGDNTETDNSKRWETLKDIAELKKVADGLRERHKGEMRSIHKIIANSDPTLPEPKSIEDLEKLVTPSKRRAAKNQPEETWTLSTQYPTSTPLGVMPTGEFPNLDLPASLDKFQQARFLTTSLPPKQHLESQIDNNAATAASINNPPIESSAKKNEISGDIQPKVVVVLDVEEEDAVVDSEVRRPAKLQYSAANVGTLFSAYKDLF